MTRSLYVSDNAIVLQTTVSVAMYVFNIERWIRKQKDRRGESDIIIILVAFVNS